MTEDEAKTKICPTLASGVLGGLISAGVSKLIVESTCMCHASGCVMPEYQIWALLFSVSLCRSVLFVKPVS